MTCLRVLGRERVAVKCRGGRTGMLVGRQIYSGMQVFWTSLPSLPQFFFHEQSRVRVVGLRILSSFPPGLDEG